MSRCRWKAAAFSLKYPSPLSVATTSYVTVGPNIRLRSLAWNRVHVASTMRATSSNRDRPLGDRHPSRFSDSAVRRPSSETSAVSRVGGIAIRYAELAAQPLRQRDHALGIGRVLGVGTTLCAQRGVPRLRCLQRSARHPNLFLEPRVLRDVRVQLEILADCSGRVLTEVLDAARQVADEPQEHVHCRCLDVPACLPPGDGVAPQAQKLGQRPLSQVQALSD